MAFSVGLAMALGKAAVGIGKKVSGHLKSKNAGDPSLVDPTQSALVNLMQRERRAMSTGTSDAGARNTLAKDSKNVIRRSMLGGKRDLSDYIKLRAQGEAAITQSRAGERLGMLKNITDENRNMADRSMDLVALKGDRDRLSGEAQKQTASKNINAQIPVIQDALDSKLPDGRNKKGKDSLESEKGKDGLGSEIAKILKGLKGD